MATTISSLDLKLAADGISVVPALVKAVDAFGAFTTSFTNGAAIENDVINIPVSSITAGAAAWNASSNNYLTAGTDAVTGVGVTLNQRLKQTSLIEAKYIPRLDLQSKLQELALVVIQKAQLNIYNSLTAATFGAAAFTGLASTFDSLDIADMEVAANDANLGPNRIMVINDAYAAALKKTDVLINMRNANGVNDSAMFANISGFDLLSTNLLKSASTVTAENLVGFFTDKSAIGIAAAYVNTDGVNDSGVTIERAVIGGFPIQFRMFYDRSTDQVSLTAEVLFGFSTVRAGSLKRMISA